MSEASMIDKDVQLSWQIGGLGPMQGQLEHFRSGLIQHISPWMFRR